MYNIEIDFTRLATHASRDAFVAMSGITPEEAESLVEVYSVDIRRVVNDVLVEVSMLLKIIDNHPDDNPVALMTRAMFEASTALAVESDGDIADTRRYELMSKVSAAALAYMITLRVGARWQAPPA